MQALRAITVAGLLLAGASVRAASDAPAQMGGIAATIRALESMGNRSTLEKQWEAARWIAGRFSDIGLSAEIRTYDVDGKSWPNVVATIPGRSRPEESILAISHLDSISFDSPADAPGADDNATGVGVLLEVARQLRGQALQRTLQLVVFGNEERAAAGSRAFAKSARRAGSQIVAVVNFDVLGYSAESRTSEWERLGRVRSTKAKAKALLKMAHNFFRSLWEPPRVIQVVGRPLNAALVHAVASRLGQDGRVQVKEVVKKDCG